MVNADLLRIVDSISRDKNIDKDLIFGDIEQAMVSAVRKAFGQNDEVDVTIDRLTGEVTAVREGAPVSMAELGRIPAQTAKQVIIQKIREAERGSIFEEFIERKGQIVSGTVARFEGGALIVNIGRTEGFLPRSEQIPGESHHPGERIRVMILDVREAPHQVKIVLSRTHPDLVKRLFEAEVPEVAERIIQIKAMAREPGYRTKVAVSSIDSRVDAVGACVGVRGSRIKNIVEELGGEKIDIVRWNESSQILIGNALKPAEIQDTALCFELGRATVVVSEDQLSLAIGKRGQNVRLAARLTGWDVDIVTPNEYNRSLDVMDKTLSVIDGIDEVFLAKLTAIGIISLMDIEEVGSEPLVNELDVSEELAKQIVAISAERAKGLVIELEAEKKAKAEARAAARAAEAAAAAGEDVPTAAGTAADESTASPAGGGENVPETPAEQDAEPAERAEVGETPAEQDAEPAEGAEVGEVADAGEASSENAADESGEPPAESADAEVPEAASADVAAPSEEPET